MTPIFVLVLSLVFLKRETRDHSIHRNNNRHLWCDTVFSDSLLALNEVLGVIIINNKIEVFILTSYLMTFASLLLLETTTLSNNIVVPSINN